MVVVVANLNLLPQREGDFAAQAGRRQYQLVVDDVFVHEALVAEAAPETDLAGGGDGKQALGERDVVVAVGVVILDQGRHRRDGNGVLAQGQRARVAHQVHERRAGRSC